MSAQRRQLNELDCKCGGIRTGILKAHQKPKLSGVTGKTDEQYRVASSNERQAIISGVACRNGNETSTADILGFMLTDRVHRVGSKLEDTIKDQCTTLEEDVAPIPSIIFDDIVSFSFDPQIESDEGDTAYPPRIQSG